MQCFPDLEDEIIYKNFKRYVKGQKSKSSNRFGYALAFMDQEQINGYTWNGGKVIAYVKKAIGFKNCQVTFKLEEQDSKFYKETLMSKERAQIPKKKGLDPRKYGGYTGKSMAYIVAVEYKENKKIKKKLIGIPIYIHALVKQKVISQEEYIAETINTTDFRILKEHILKYQLIEEKGNSLYIVGEREVINAKELCFEQEKQYLIKHIKELCFSDGSTISEEDNQMLVEIFIYLKDKIANQYPIYDNVMKLISDSIDFYGLQVEKKAILIQQLILLCGANSTTANLKIVDKSLTNRAGRKEKYTVDLENTYFIDKSITGLYERRYKI